MPAVGRFIVFGDPHLCLPAPASRVRDTWVEETESLFEQIVGAVQTYKPDAVCCTADIFHSKASTSHEAVVWALKLFGTLAEAIGAPVYCPIGNHDMVGNNTADAHTRQPYGVLERAGVIRSLELGPVDLKCGCSLVGASYGPWFGKLKVPGRPTLVISHGELYAAGEGREQGQSPEYKSMIKSLESHPAIKGWVNGHLHKLQGGRVIASEDGSRWFANIGCLSRVAVDEAEVCPSLALVKIGAGGGSGKLIELGLTCPGMQAFTDAAAHEPVGYSDHLAEFVARIRDDDAEAVADPRELARRLGSARGVPAAAVDLAIRYLDGAAGEV